MVCAMRKAGVLSILFVVVPLAVAVIAEAQQPTKVHRMGFLSSLSPAVVLDRVEAFRQGLRELGYVERKTTGASEGHHSETLARGSPGKFNCSRQCASVKRDGTGRGSFRRQASICRNRESRGDRECVPSGKEGAR